MHLAVQLHVVDHLAAVCLQRATEVAERDAGHAGDDPVGDPGRHDSPRVVAPVASPAAHNVVALVDLLQQVRYVVRVVLHVAVQKDEHRAAAVVDPRLDRRRLAEVAAEAHDADA